mmetsp:Transcript_33484/g.95259  ORF Transcript_33484/g.95259 Transcript_33484/m.95259 type:complete len:234 (+) Transcript_33484:464-1165(+)
MPSLKPSNTTASCKKRFPPNPRNTWAMTVSTGAATSSFVKGATPIHTAAPAQMRAMVSAPICITTSKPPFSLSISRDTTIEERMFNVIRSAPTVTPKAKKSDQNLGCFSNVIAEAKRCLASSLGAAGTPPRPSSGDASASCAGPAPAGKARTGASSTSHTKLPQVFTERSAKAASSFMPKTTTMRKVHPTKSNTNRNFALSPLPGIATEMSIWRVATAASRPTMGTTVANTAT